MNKENVTTKVNIPNKYLTGKVQEQIIVQRGEIWMADLGKYQYISDNETDRSCVQGNLRPCLVIQNMVGNIYSTTTQIIPITTSKTKSKIPTHVEISIESGLQKPSILLVEQQRVIDKKVLKYKVGFATEEVLKSVEQAMILENQIQIEEHITPEIKDKIIQEHIEQKAKEQVINANYVKRKINNIINFDKIINNREYETDLKFFVQQREDNYREVKRYCEKFRINVDKLIQKELIKKRELNVNTNDNKILM